MGSIRFIRRNGRIIPIRGTSGAPNVVQEARKSYGKTAAIAATSAGLRVGVAGIAAALSHKKVAIGAQIAGVGIWGVNQFRQIKEAKRISDMSNGERSTVGELLRQGTADFVGATAGGFVSRVGLKKGVKYTILTKEAAKAGADSLHKTVKPYTSQYADYRKFKNSKWVMSTKPVMGLLK